MNAHRNYFPPLTINRKLKRFSFLLCIFSGLVFWYFIYHFMGDSLNDHGDTIGYAVGATLLLITCIVGNIMFDG